jgi:hypothetical protein
MTGIKEEDISNYIKKLKDDLLWVKEYSGAVIEHQP